MKMKSTGIAIALFAVVSLGTSAAQAAQPFCITIVASKQGTLAGGSGQKASLCGARIEGLGFSYGVVSPRDQSTGQATGRRQHKPVRIKKEWNAASPQLFQALITGEPLSTVTLNFYVTDQMTGQLVVDHTINLSNAFVTSIEHALEPLTSSSAKSAADVNATETVEITFQRIELIDSRGKTSAID
jgi:type VI secretion system secreted protein Hcp